MLPVARGFPRRGLPAPCVQRQHEQEEHDEQPAGDRAAHEPAVAGTGLRSPAPVIRPSGRILPIRRLPDGRRALRETIFGIYIIVFNQ